MANLRLLEIKTSDSTSIHARFTEELDTLLNTSNVVITSHTPGIPDPEVLAISVSKDILSITTQPLTPYAAYFVEFKSTDSAGFKSKRGSFLLQDGKTNVPLILGAEEPDNPIRPYLLGYLKDNIYDTDDVLMRDIINSQSDLISRALYAIRQAKNDNYLTVLVENELKTRGAGPFDRLTEEGAYEVVRVGTSPSGTFLSSSKSFDIFPSGPITLQAVQHVETLTVGSGVGTFNKLLLTVSKYPVVKLISLTVAYQGGGSASYNVETLGYQLQNPRYDSDHASTLLTLENNQIKLSDTILEDSSFVPPASGDEITVIYEYKSLGKIIDEDSVAVSQVLDAVRVAVPPIVTQFTLRHFPIVTASDVIATSGGVQFLDPHANPPFSDIHPAFERELPFKFDGLPINPGEYSVDYETGRVFVYGEETNDGTGNFPPVCTYKYRKTYVSRLDYTYDPSTYEVVASPLRDLVDEEDAKISFSYEDTLIPGIDFIAQVHSEVLDERVQNRVTSTGSLATLQTPITNVFRVFNESSGELYRIQRWNDHSVYFSSNVPPQIDNIVRERVNFTDVPNEVLVVSEELLNSSNIRIFKIPLLNNRIMSSSEDVIGASFNTSANFSRTDLFSTELYFDGQILDLENNLDRLIIGQYQIDYINGVVYVAIEDDQDYDLGTINYKKSTITTTHDHLISISELYTSISVVSGINKRIPYSSFTDTEILPSSFDLADERFLNGDEDLPYTLLSDTITVTDDIKDVRGVFDAADLNTNIQPTNFGEDATVSANIITLAPVGKTQITTIDAGLIVTVDFISNGAEIAEVTSVLRISDNVELWDGYGLFAGYDITLSGATGAVAGQEVLVTYTVKLNGAATPVVDYNRGDYYADYTYLLDEILVSYEYGDNNLDFRQSDALDIGDTYYVTYRVGALRTALLKNFGSLVNIPILNNFDTSLPRERYREALMAALQSFTKGPTLPSMKSLVSTITHIEPEIIESAFENWSLGISHLYSNQIETAGDVQLMIGKYDHGVLLSEVGQTISMPASSNVRLEEGTFESWIIPDWDGLDNDATLTINVNRNGEVLPTSEIFIGSTSYNPSYDDDFKFVLNKSDESDPSGLPSAVYTHTGLFLYYDSSVKRWKFLVKERVADGYVYSGTIETSGEFYDVKFLPGLKEINDFTRTIKNKIDFELHIDSLDELSPDGYVDGYSLVDGYFPADGYVAGYSFDGFQFMSDEEHYIFDVGEETDRNRISLLKDGRGYISFRVWDRGNTQGKRNKREISYDISDWEAGEKHHVATTWRLNSSDRRDEMHLFIDGFEVPNIMKYGGRPEASSTDRFRTIKPEILAGTVPLNCVVGNDLVTTAGSPIVTSSIDFDSLNIVPGHTIEVRELGFSTYNILAVSGSSLTLDTVMPASLSDARFSVNPFSAVVSSQIDLYENIIVSIIRDGEETELPGLRADIPAYAISKDAFNQNILTILGEAEVGDQIAIRTLGLNHRRCRERHYIWGNTSNVLKTQLPPPISLDEVKIFPVLLPLTSIGPNNAVFGSGVFTATGLEAGQPTNASEGRTLSIRMTGGNVDFSTPATVTIHGTTASGALNETIVFNGAATKYSTEKFKTISSVEAVAKPVLSSRNSVSIEIKEKYSITYPDGNNIYPVIRFSYQTQTGSSLTGTIGSATVTDTEGYFPASAVGQLLVLSAPGSVAGSYTITARNSDTSIEVSPALPASFTDGFYNIYNVSIARSGFQNGFFTLEQAGSANTPFTLNQGWYEFDYSIYLEIPMESLSNTKLYFGSDFQGENQAKAVLDEIRILSKTLTDVRVGESLGVGEDSITTDFTSLRPLKKDSDTLVLLHLDELPLVNETDYWVTATRQFIQSSTSVNENFEKSIVITDKPLMVDNRGLLSTSSEGSIEFWVSPRYDTYNDPNFRYYFDASSSAVEEVTSITNGSLKVSGRIGSVLSVRLQTDIANTGVNYFVNGEILSDFQTIKLGKALPYQKTPVKVNYIPSGLNGDRISIYKDREGFITFNVRVDETDYQVRQPVFWERDSWHRVQATYKFNRSDNRDELRLFVDGEERGLILFGSGLVFSENLIFGQGFSGNNGSTLTTDINFSDPINQFYVGSDYLMAQTAQARMDNLRLSNKARSPLIVAGQPRDINYSSNLDIVLPVVEDIYTTYLLNFSSLIEKTEEFALLRDEKFGIFNFTLNIIDSFGIVSDNAKVKQVLENLIRVLKPGQSKATINYFV